MAQTLDVLAHIDNLLQILILAVAEDRVVDDDAIDRVISVGCDQRVLDVVFVDFTERVVESTVEGRLSVSSKHNAPWQTAGVLQHRKCTVELTFLCKSGRSIRHRGGQLDLHLPALPVD